MTIKSKNREKSKKDDFTIVLIGHPIRTKGCFIINNEKYKISFDKFKSLKNNEDPFVWNKNFLYSFCHANHALSSDIRNKVKKRENVYLIFVARVNSESEIFEIDTIIKAKDIYEWPDKEKRHRSELCKTIFTDKVVDYHLPKFNEDVGISEHNNIHLYTCIGDEHKSFLPMIKKEDEFEPFSFDKDLSDALVSLLTVEGNKGYYVAKKTSKRLSSKQDIFDRISEEIRTLIKLEHESETKPITNKRFLKGYQIQMLDEEKRTKIY